MHPGETGELEWDRQWWRSSRWAQPSESDIAANLVGKRSCRRARPSASQCIGGVPRAVPWVAGEGGGGWLWWWPLAVRGHWQSTCTAATAPSPRLGWPRGVVGLSLGEPH